MNAYNMQGAVAPDTAYKRAGRCPSEPVDQGWSNSDPRWPSIRAALVHCCRGWLRKYCSPVIPWHRSVHPASHYADHNAGKPGIILDTRPTSQTK